MLNSRAKRITQANKIMETTTQWVAGLVLLGFLIYVQVKLNESRDSRRELRYKIKILNEKIDYVRDDSRFRINNPPKHNVGDTVVYNNREYIVKVSVPKTDNCTPHWFYELKGKDGKTIEIRE